MSNLPDLATFTPPLCFIQLESKIRKTRILTGIEIDLSTANSLIAVCDGAKPRLFRNRVRKVMTTSAASLDHTGN